MVVHRDQAEQVVVVLGHRLSGPVFVHCPDLELFVIPAELHVRAPSSAAAVAQHPALISPSWGAECGRCLTLSGSNGYAAAPVGRRDP
jgi:hypothetical protein